MPTIRIAKLGRERTVATLARKLYKIGRGADAADLQSRAEAALLSANPRLDRADGFRYGADVFVPEIPGLDMQDSVGADLDTGAPLNELRLRLQEASSRFEDEAELAARQRAETLDRIGDRKFQSDARKAMPESGKLLEAAAEHLKAEDAVAGRTSAQLQKALGEALATVDKLEKLARRAVPD